MKVQQRIEDELQKRKDVNSLRELKIVNDKVDFSSNDYLGLAQNEDLRKLILKEAGKLRRLGSGGSRLLTGNYSLLEKAEKEIADFHEAESALFFNSGYEANSGLLATVTKRNDTILYDELCHASLREGIRLSNATSFSFAHNDLSDLENKLSKSNGEKFIVVESVYSMDGDICPLKEIVELANKYKAQIILDEAHATGVIGERGEGLAQHFRLQDQLFARVHTFGKAIGFNGAVVLGSNTLRNYLINFCRPFIYTTAPNFLNVVAVMEAYNYMKGNAHLVQKLKEKCNYFKQKVGRYKQIKLVSSDSAIFSVIIPGNEHVKLASAYIQNGGHDVRPILSPTVATGEERLRICIHVYNSELEIERLVKLLDQIIQSLSQD